MMTVADAVRNKLPYILATSIRCTISINEIYYRYILYPLSPSCV